ncbi:MAG: hypothetical protein JWP97_4283 [Labilithrix sp.]|nr:hypothetical protein [Labilithrix sp.]
MRIPVLLTSCIAGALAALLSSGPVSCGSTGSARFAFEARAGGIERDPAQPLTFVNATGWTITLTRAMVTIGPVYLNVIAPLRDDRSSGLPRFLGIRSALGDDDHLGPGREVGEVLAQVTFDALSPELVSFPVAGSMTQEQVRTAEVWFWPPPGAAPDTPDAGTVLDVAGTATRAGSYVAFRGALVLDDAWATDAKPGEHSAQSLTELRKVRGIPTTFYPTEGGFLEIRFDVRALFRGAELADLSSNPTDTEGTRILVQSKAGKYTTDQVMRNLFQGTRASTGTYAVHWRL